MAWSKSTRICMMIVLDTIFLVLELTVGYWKGSLALVADAFHMLNDIISLAVGLWAVRLAKKETTDKFSYGWLRAEILGAFFNATFLIGLCLTIILEALQRFANPVEISDPEIILVVGAVGLASNLLGFWILGGHGHSHGGHEHEEEDGEHAHAHDHDHSGHVHGDISCAEEGHAHGPSAADEDAPIGDLLPEAVVARSNARHITFDQDTGSSAAQAGDLRNKTGLARAGSRASNASSGRSGERRRAGSMRHNRLTSIDDIRIHPSSFRQDLLETISGNRRSFDQDEYDSNPENDDVPEEAIRESEEGTEPTEETPLVKHDEAHSSAHNHGDNHKHGVAHRGRRGSTTHVAHHHSKPKQKGGHGGHGHSHGDMGMNAMVLHVLGDALGNIGVIITAIIIWKTTWTYRFYADPAVSLLITLIILRSAIPLTKATSKILLQAVPDHIDLREIREDIQDLPGVISCHHIHVWQLSDTKLVASMHIEVAFPIAEGGGEKYMALQKRARKCLHAYGIHSATIQPEFRVNKLLPFLPPSAAGASAPNTNNCSRSNNANGGNSAAAMPTGTGLDGTVADGLMDQIREGDTCLLECVEDCVGKGCCSSQTASPPGSSHSAPTSIRDNEDHH